MKVVKPPVITLLHPSRGRAEKAKKTFDYWIKASSGAIPIEHILSIDADENFDAYKNAFTDSQIKVPTTCVVNPNKNVVEATNMAANLAKGDILIYLSDDFKCPDLWDELIIKAFRLVGDKPMLLKVDDCLQKFHIAVLTIPIMNVELYKKLGYFWHPGYRSMFVDEDLYWTCKNNDWMICCPWLLFPHEHPANGKAENDDTYRRSAANWDQGKEFFAKRKGEGFPL